MSDLERYVKDSLAIQAINWIANNDEPTVTDPDVIEGFITVQMAADLFDKDTRYLAVAIAARRDEGDK